MKKLICSCLMLFAVLGAGADEPQQKFSPEKYWAELEQYITNEACLTPKEAAAFFPLLREMKDKQRNLYNQMKAEGKIKPTDDDACKKAIQKRDQIELEQKSILQTYHNRFFTVLPASKVWDAIKAEDRFNRKMFRNWGKGQPNKGQPSQKK